MIFDLNEGVNVMEEEATSEFFDSLEDIELDTNLEDTALLSNYVGIKADSMYNKLMEAVAISELEAVQESGSTMIYEGATDRIKTFFEKVKAFFKKVGEYIKAFFKKVFTMIKAIFQDGDKFWASEGKYVEAGWNQKGVDEWKFTGYKYNTAAIESTKYSVKDILPKSQYNKFIDGTNFEKGTWISSDGKIPAYKFSDVFDRKSVSEYKAYYHGLFRSGSSEGRALTSGDSLYTVAKKEYKVKDVYSVNTLKSIITGYSISKKAADADYKNASAQISDAIKSVDVMKKEVEDIAKNETKAKNFTDGINYNLKSDEKVKSTAAVDMAMKLAAYMVSGLKDAQKILNAIHSEHVSAMKAQHSQALSIARKLALKGAGKTKVKNFKESTDFLADLEF